MGAEATTVPRAARAAACTRRIQVCSRTSTSAVQPGVISAAIDSTSRSESSPMLDEYAWPPSASASSIEVTSGAARSVSGRESRCELIA
jgi:hypothetical protein